MILLHSGYGIGSFVIPLYTNPFLAVERKEMSNNGTLVGSTEMTPNTTAFSSMDALPKYLKESRIEYTYMISAILVAVHSISFYIFQYREKKYVYTNVNSVGGGKHDDNGLPDKPQEKSRSLLQMINPATCTNGRMLYGLCLFAVLFLYFANVGGGERVVAGFVRSFSIDQLNFSPEDASYLNTSFWISFTVGRVLFSLAAKWISVRKLVIIETSGLTVVGILMAIFARSNRLACWILVQPMGIFQAPLWPSGVAWTDYHLELTGVGMTIILLGGSVGGICHLRLIGYLYQHFGAHTYIYQVVGIGSFALVLAIVLDMVSAKHGSRFKWNTARIEKCIEATQPDSEQEPLD